MKDKEKIKQEIESYKESMKGLKPHSDFRRGQITAYNQIIQFIDSLPEEPASKDLEEEIKNYFSNWLTDLDNHKGFLLQIARHFAEWGRNHFEDKSEMVSEDLEEEMIRWHREHFSNKRDWEKTSGEYLTRKSQLDLAHHFAEWQRKKDQETIELAEDHAMLAGMNKMKEEMMENAIESVVEDWCGDSPEVTIPLNPQDFKTGDKLKILILKTE